MSITLKPYSVYVLYIAIAFVFCFLVYVMMKFVEFLKAIQTHQQPLLESINTKNKDIKDKIADIQNTYNTFKKKYFPIISNLLLVYSIYQLYKQDTEHTGFKSLSNATIHSLKHRKR